MSTRPLLNAMASSHSCSPSSKRIKLEDELLIPAYKDLEEVEIPKLEEPEMKEDSENSCSICLHSIVNRTVIPKCSHDFCFECLLVWTEQSRRCPLCSQTIGNYVIHSIRSRYDYQKHYLPPLRTSPPSSRPAQTNAVLQNTRQRRRRDRDWEARARGSDEADKLERSISKRKWIYRHDLYAKHVASNVYTKYRPYPTPAQFAASQDLISRTTTFLRRELQIWEGLDVEFLTALIISLMKSIDIRSESAVKLISEFLDMDAPYVPGGRHVNAEHFAHEVYSYVRSPYKDLFVYDTVVQYDTPPHLPQPTDIERSHRWRDPSPLQAGGPSADGRHRSQKRSRSKSSERSMSWSPSGRKYSLPRNTGSSNYRRISTSERNSRSPRPSNDVPESWDKRRQNADSGHTGRQNHLDNVSQTPVASSSTERGKEMPIFSTERDVKGKRRADETGMTTSITEGPDSEIVGSNFGQVPVKTEKDDELDGRTRNTKPTKNFRIPRNRTLLESVKAHLAVPVESAQENRADRSSTNPQSSSNIVLQTIEPISSLLTRLSDPPYVPTLISTKARNVSDDCQQHSGGHDKDENETLHGRHPGQNLSHHDNSINTHSFGRQQRPQLSSLSRSQDSMQSGSSRPPEITRSEKERPSTSSKNSYVSTNVINNQSPPVPSANSILLTTVEDNTMAPYQAILSRSLPVFNCSQKQDDSDNPPNQFLQPRSSIDGHLNFPNQSGTLAHAITLNSLETRTRLLARLELEKRQVNSSSPRPLDDGPSCSYSSSAVPKKNPPCDRGATLKLHEPAPDLTSDHLVSDESRKTESKLRARAQLRVRLAAEKRLAG